MSTLKEKKAMGKSPGCTGCLGSVFVLVVAITALTLFMSPVKSNPQIHQAAHIVNLSSAKQ